MKPVAIVRHSTATGAGYFATFLEAHGIAWRLFAVDRGDAVPEAATAFAGIASLGGPMSVNDPLPWIDAECALIRDAVAQNIPVIGHCLGGQLLSKALGGAVTRNTVREIGWGIVHREETPATRRWLGDLPAELTVFQWHGETFTLPAGASRLLSGRWCANQMMVLGPHLGMQFHPEMTPAMIAAWCREWTREERRPRLRPSVQAPAVMQAETAERLPAMRRLTDRLYGEWIKGLRR